MEMQKSMLPLFLFLFSLSPPGLAQKNFTAKPSNVHNSSNEIFADELSKELQNPNSPLSSLTFKHTYTSFKGDLPETDDRSSSVTFKPLLKGLNNIISSDKSFVSFSDKQPKQGGEK